MSHKVFEYVGNPRNGDGNITVSYSQHVAATQHGRTNAHGRALIKLLAAWEEYADAHQDRFGDGIGDDYVLGPYWANVGLAIKRLLDGETGGLDCGSIDRRVSEQIEAAGFKTDGYSLLDETTPPG